MTSFSGMGPYSDGAILSFGLQFVGWAVAAMLQTEVFYDILGGTNYLLIAVLSKIETPTTDVFDKNTVFVGLFAISRGWLLVFLAWRAHHRKGDSRFDGIRDKPARFLVFWMAQALWVYFVSLPLLVVVSNSKPTNTVADGNIEYDSLMLLGMALSILVEIQSDIVKAKWVARGRPGGFCTEGPWKYSRHPNYAGEISTWVFAAGYAVLVSGMSWQSALVASISPMFTMNVLLNMEPTGVWNAEGKNLKRYYEHKDPVVSKNYAEYRRTTPPVFPIFAIPYESVPLGVQRKLLFEWERFDYRPSSKGKAE